MAPWEVISTDHSRQPFGRVLHSDVETESLFTTTGWSSARLIPMRRRCCPDRASCCFSSSSKAEEKDGRTTLRCEGPEAKVGPSGATLTRLGAGLLGALTVGAEWVMRCA